MRRLRPTTPQAVTYVLGGLVAVTASLIVTGLVLVVAAAFLPSGVAGDVLGWCDPTVVHAHGFWWVGIPFAVALVLLAKGAVTQIRRHLRRPRPVGTGPILVTPARTPLAYSVPGRPGQVVVSQAMLQSLNDVERRALLAHERSHLRHRHHRYLLLADLACVFPPVRPSCRLLRFYLERWADEDAARHVGSRKVVAQAIARAALATTTALPAGALAMSNLGVPGRVQALLGDSSNYETATGDVARHARTVVASMAASGAATAGLFLLVAGLCS